MSIEMRPKSERLISVFQAAQQLEIALKLLDDYDLQEGLTGMAYFKVMGDLMRIQVRARQFAEQASKDEYINRESASVIPLTKKPKKP